MRPRLVVIPTLALLLLARAAFALGIPLFRPLTADPRENQSRWRMVVFTEDWRYGTDITDPSSRGGWREDRTGYNWEASAGETFRWRPLERMGPWRPPWVRYQPGVTGGMFVDFDDQGALLNSDYQYGLSLDVMWSGGYDPEIGIADFDRAVVTSRTVLGHKSVHLGDEYVTMSRFGDNQLGFTGDAFDAPPVKRVDLAYEFLQATLSIERALPFAPRATLRAYGGGELKLALWGVGGVYPKNFRSPSGRVGLELRSAGNDPGPSRAWPARLARAVSRDRDLHGGWIAAFDLRLARPFNFAGCDNPRGGDEAWTPSLWTDCRYGHEFERYAGSWHGMVGATLFRDPTRRNGPGRRAGPEWILALEWYRGYSPHGQFIDQRLRYRPRWWVLPSVTAHF